MGRISWEIRQQEKGVKQMSGIKARLMKPTGLEWFDGSFKIAAEVWKFICHEYKNKAADQSKSKGERTRADIPKRYWETHAVPLHKLSRKIIRKVRKAYQSYPVTPELVKKRKKHLKNALDCCFAIYDELRLTLDEMPNLDANKTNGICDALEKEIAFLSKERRNVRLVNQGEKKTGHEPTNPAPKG